MDVLLDCEACAPRPPGVVVHPRAPRRFGRGIHLRQIDGSTVIVWLRPEAVSRAMMIRAFFAIADLQPRRTVVNLLGLAPQTPSFEGCYGALALIEQEVRRAKGGATAETTCFAGRRNATGRVVGRSYSIGRRPDDARQPGSRD